MPMKADLNRSGWETTDMPSVCERCLPDNPYVQMLKEDYGAECKLCTRPFTIFRWKADRTSRQKRTGICLTCARLKNCCQCCMLDLSFGLPITIRDAALKMVAPGPTSGVNREYFAQNNEHEIEEGRGLEGYEKTDDKARELLRRLASSEPYYKKQRRLEAENEAEGEQKLLEGGENVDGAQHTPGPIRTADSRKSAYGNAHLSRGGSAAGGSRGGKPGTGRRPFPSTAALPPQPQDILPPSDPNITSLFITGVEDDMPEHLLRTHFSQFGPLRSLAAAEACHGRAIVKGVPLRVQWGKPKPLDNMDREARMENARAGRGVMQEAKKRTGGVDDGMGAEGAIGDARRLGDGSLEGFGVMAPPPGETDVEYAAMAGE
ncbi:Pre-mRNA-splicing factor slt11 [Friedmanniomyces endolithicus]|nr:Pre-mRNA-splicing factor slt11 [Friedmanniomyces endolithicus]